MRQLCFLYIIIQIVMRPVKHINVEHCNQVLTNFGITLIIYQVLLILCFGIFVRMNPNPTTDLLDHQRPISLLSINFMALLGFGLLLTTLRTNSFTALVYSLLVVALVVQLYILIQAFWAQIFTAFQQDFNIFMNQQLLIQACYCVISSLIAMSAIIGRINPTDIVKFATMHVVGYGLVEQLVYRILGAHDAGGGMVVHVYGAYFGLAVSMVLARQVLPTTRPQRNYQSHLLALLGTFFLWIFWPFFNFGLHAHNSYERTQIITNTYCSLTCSTLAVFIVTAIHGRGILVNDIQHATLAGGVAVAASCGIVYIPAVSMTIGFFAGIISANCLHYFNKKIQKSFKLYDPHMVHSTHGIPGLLGVVVSAIILMIYASGYDFQVAANYSTNTIFNQNTNFMKQGGFQLLALISALGIGLLFGLATGKFIQLFYTQKEEYFFEDSTYFDRQLFLNMEDREVKYEEAEEKKVPVVEQRRQRPERQMEMQRPRRSRSPNQNYQKTDETQKKRKSRKSRTKQK